MGRWKRKSTSKKRYHHHRNHDSDDHTENKHELNDTNNGVNNNNIKENESNDNNDINTNTNNVPTTENLENGSPKQQQQDNNKEQRGKRQQKDELVITDRAITSTTTTTTNNHNDKKITANNITSFSPARIKRFSYFNSHEKIQVRSYLENFRNIATNNTNEINNNNINKDSVIIGGHEFPNIYNTNNTIQSYLKLPKTLTSKHRHYLHDLCLELDLYHDSYYDEENKRCMAISIDIDALAQILVAYNKDITNKDIPLRICKPWFYLFHNDYSINNNVTTPIKDNRTLRPQSQSSQDNHTLPKIPCNYVKQRTAQFESIIQRYIDNPLLCIINNNQIIQDDVVSSIEKFYNKDDSTDNSDNDNVSSTVLPYESDSWMYVDTVDKLKQCINEIKELNPKEIGFDFELHNKNKYTCITCLIQLSTIEKTYVIDPYATNDNNGTNNKSPSSQEAQQQQPSSPTFITPTPTFDEEDHEEGTVWNTIPKLSQFFSNPNIIKIGHCINSMDIPALHRDFGIFCVNVFDTHEAARILKINKQGLASLCNYYKLTPGSGDKDNTTEYSKLKELYQRQDWRCRPLHDDMLRYARYDVYYLIQLRKCMVQDILLMDEPERIKLTTMNRKLISRTLASNMSEKRFSSPRSIASSNASDDEGYFTPAEDEFEDLSLNGDDDVNNTNNNNDTNNNMSKIIQKYYKTYLQVLKLSQKNCTSFWKHKIETYTQNETKRDIQKKEGPRWTTSHEYLYNNLISWRNQLAYNIYNTMPGILISTELLVYIAYKRPTTYEELRYISFILPQILEDNDYNCRDEIFSLVQSSFDREYHPHHQGKKVASIDGSPSTRSSPSKKTDSTTSSPSLKNASSSQLSNDNKNNHSPSSLSTKDTTTEKNNHNDDNIIKEKDETNEKKDVINHNMNKSKLILKYSMIILAISVGSMVIFRHHNRNRGKR